MDGAQDKRCSRCGLMKPAGSFGRNHNSKDGLAATCRPCAAEARRLSRKTKSEFCGCGCGKPTNGTRFLKGHQFRRGSPSRITGVKPLDVEIDSKPINFITALEKETLRRKAQTDLRWLAKEIIGLPIAPCHDELFDLLVKKDPDKPIEEQSAIKRRIFLLPRGSFKTTIGVIDLLQWIICFPNVRILIVRGQRQLAIDMVEELKGHFVNNEKIRFLFPEFCADTTKKLGVVGKMLCPMRTVTRREATVEIVTPQSKRAGRHGEIFLIDDLQDDLNSLTRVRREQTIQAYNTLLPILEAAGYITVSGTRYHPDDLYGHLLAEAQRKPELWKSLVRPAWKLRDGANRDSADPADYDLWFPERLTFPVLLEHKSTMTASGHGWMFSCQYLNQPAISDAPPLFERNLLLNHTLPVAQIPSTGLRFQMWDTAPGQKRFSDFNVCLTAIICNGRLYVIDSFRDHVQPAALPGMIVDYAAKHTPVTKVGIEAAAGTEYMLPLIIQAAQASQCPLDIHWFKPPRFKDAKLARISAVQALLASGRVWFSAALPHLKELMDELEDVENTRHDDLADALSYLVQFLDMTPTRTWFAHESEPQPQIELPELIPGMSNPCGAFLVG